MVEIKTCSTDLDFSLALHITRDYIRWLNIDLSFQNIEHELSNFSSMYVAPNGLFLLAWYNGKLAGGVGFRKFDTKVCEMKRLFVYEQFRGMGLGKSLCVELIKKAKKFGYEKMRLDTLGRMKAAIKLYKTLGFKEITPYCFNPDQTAKFMEMNLK